jgi:hypothetical protein
MDNIQDSFGYLLGLAFSLSGLLIILPSVATMVFGMLVGTAARR